MVESTCQWCGDVFEHKKCRDAKYCSMECFNEYRSSDKLDKKVELECTQCSKTYHKLPSAINDAENQFCSKECLGKHKRKEKGEWYDKHSGSARCPECGETFARNSEMYDHHAEEHYDGTRSHERECPTCGVEFDSTRAMRIHHHSSHDESLAMVERECKNCHTTFEVREWELKHHKYDYCSAKCHYEHGYGGKGTERVRRILTDDGEHWEEIAHKTREQANGVCEMCGSKTPTHGRPGLQVHHIIPLRYGGTHTEWNLAALCPSCHGKAETKANELFGQFNIWGSGECLIQRPRDSQGRFRQMQTD